MQGLRRHSIGVLRNRIATTLDEVDRGLDALRGGNDVASTVRHIVASLGRISPVLDELHELLGASHVADPSPAGETRRVLVVDDSPGHRLLAALSLSDAGYVVQSAADGSEAWALLQEHTFDVVVSDGEMPGMDGLELLRRVRSASELTAMPAILLTGLDARRAREAALSAGADAFVCKHEADSMRVLLAYVERLTCGGGTASHA